MSLFIISYLEVVLPGIGYGCNISDPLVQLDLDVYKRQIHCSGTGNGANTAQLNCDGGTISCGRCAKMCIRDSLFSVPFA